MPSSTMQSSRPVQLAIKAHDYLAAAGKHFQSVLLLLIRLYWGWQFFITGKAHLANLQDTTDFFASLHLPMPKLQAIIAGSTECAGGLLLFLGLGSRIISVPLAFTMIIAYLTADLDKVKGIFRDPDTFIGATPFLFLLTTLTVFAFGPGLFSADRLLNAIFHRSQKSNAAAPKHNISAAWQTTGV